MTAALGLIMSAKRKPRLGEAGLSDGLVRAWGTSHIRLGRPEKVQTISASGEQIGAGRRELHVGSAVMHFQPAPFNGELQAGAVLRGRALVAEQEGAVEFLDIDPAILNWFEGVCVLQEATGGFVRVGEGSVGGQFQKLSLTFSNAW